MASARWSNGSEAGVYERCGFMACLRAEGHYGRHRHPVFPALGPGRCNGCGADVSYRKSKAGWRPAWRDRNGKVHRCGLDKALTI